MKYEATDPTAETPAWDKPMRTAARPHEAVRKPAAGRMPTVGEAISAWLRDRAYAPSTARAARQHLESERAQGWRAHRGIRTIDQFTAEEAAAYVMYL